MGTYVVYVDLFKPKLKLRDKCSCTHVGLNVFEISLLLTDKCQRLNANHCICCAKDIINFLRLRQVALRPLFWKVIELFLKEFHRSVHQQKLPKRRNNKHCTQTSVFQARILTHDLHLL